MLTQARHYSAAGEGYPAGRPRSEFAAGHGADAVEHGLSAADGLWLLDMLSGKPSLLLTLAQLWDAVVRGPLSGRTDPLTGLQYHHAEAPPLEAAAQCMHWVSSPQVASSSDADRRRPLLQPCRLSGALCVV